MSSSAVLSVVAAPGRVNRKDQGGRIGLAYEIRSACRYWQAKRRLAYALNQLLDQREVTQTTADRLPGLSQPKVSPAQLQVERILG